MRRLFMAVPLLVLTLAGCASSPDEPESVAATPDPVVPVVECLTVSDGAIAGLQWGLDQRNGSGWTVDAVSAVPNPSSELSWFVAGVFSGPGVDGQVGVWSTLTDPTTAPDVIAYQSVDAAAKEFSVYQQPVGYSSALPGVDDARSCVDSP